MKSDLINRFLLTRFECSVDQTYDREKLLQLQIDWISDLLKKSFNRLDNSFESLYKAEDEFIERNCLPLYKKVASAYRLEDMNDQRLPNYYPIQKVIIDQNKMNNKEELEILKNNIADFHRCRKISREKSDLIKEIMESKLREFHNDINKCLRVCRVKSIQNKIENCYTDCFSSAALQIPEIEQYMIFSVRQMINEFEKNESGYRPSTLTTSYRLHHRIVDNNVFNQYI